MHEMSQLLGQRFYELRDLETASSETIRLQLKHRSVRKFSTQDVTDAALNSILVAAQSASHSSNLQCWSVVVVRDPQRKSRINALLGGTQNFIEQAPVFLVWVADLHRASMILDTIDQPMETINYIEGTLVPFVDIGIASQNALLAAESLGMGGVFVGSLRNNPPGIIEELGLPHRTFPVVGMAIGHPDPKEAAGMKPRLSPSTVAHYERYREVDDWQSLSDYEEHIIDYYRGFQTTDYSWFRRVIARLGPRSGLKGRHLVRKWLQQQGFFSQ